MLIPFPYDVIGHWAEEYKVELSSEAYHELARLFGEYSNLSEDKETTHTT